MAACDFPRFRDLPTELRLQIWSHCIPGPRVVEMDTPLSRCHLTLPAEPFGRELWSSQAGRVPLIARVCREARSVALKHAQYVTADVGVTDEDGAPCAAGNVEAPVRLRKGFDIWLANQAAAASVSADLLLPFDPERKPCYTTFPAFSQPELRYFSPHRFYYAVLAIVEIHISAEEAAQAGVFGALGEEPIRLVDPRDTATIAQFRDVWERQQSGPPPHEELDVAEFFATAIDASEAYCVRVEQWRQNLEKVWLFLKGQDLGVSWPTFLEFWPGWVPATDEDRDANSFVIPRGWKLDWTRRELVREHPWVQTQLALMPRFEPAIMFRHCVGGCGRGRPRN